MAKFKVGDKVKNVNTNDVGYIVEIIISPRRNRQLYKVKYDCYEKDENSINLMLDVDLTDPFERVRQNLYGNYTEYLKGNTSFKIRSSNNSTISSLKASKTLFRPYQFKPLLKFLYSDNRRLLIADEVGLGKTIEAGHIMLELKARNELHNALVICPLALQEKWTTELNEKFGLDFVMIEDKDQFMHELRYHNGFVKVVVNYDKIRDTSEVLPFIKERNIKFSLVVCDESHRLRNQGTHIYRGARTILEVADSAVFMSATPIMMNELNLFNQLRLLDADLYDNEEVYLNNVQLNKPFVRALSMLSKGADFATISKRLSESEVITITKVGDLTKTIPVQIGEYFKEYPIYQEIMQLLAGENNATTRAKVQYDLSEMSPMSTIFSRTRKNEVTQDWSQAVRNPMTRYVKRTTEELVASSTAIDEYINSKGGGYYDEYGRMRSGNLGLITLRRQLASSVWATLSEDHLLDRGVDEFREKEDAKFNELLNIFRNEVFKNGNKKIIIFAIFKKTVKYLSIRLKEAGYNSVMIYGGSGLDKDEMLKQFREDESIQVLLSTEVGSEGLDMQFCNSMVNYDLPWNPMVVEQRIGRIDRFGQESPKVNIYNIVIQDSILENIYERLLRRIGIFRESIGDLEAILDAELEMGSNGMTIKEALKNMQQDYYSDKLTKEEIERKQHEIEQAIANERQNLEKIEENLTNTFTNDAYFKEEINKIINNNAYVTQHELYQFVIQILKDYLTTCSLEETEVPEVYKLVLSKSDPKILMKFLSDYEPNDRDSKILFSQYKREIEGKLEILFTFDQEQAFKDKSISFVNIYHPIIQAGVKMYENSPNNTQRTFFFEMDGKSMPKGIGKGKYLLAIYRISSSRTLFDKPVNVESLFPIVYDIDNDKLIEDRDTSERFMGVAQVNGRYSPMKNEYRIDNETIEEIRYDFNEFIDNQLSEQRKETQKRLENSKKMRLQQTVQYHDTRINSLKNSIDTQESLREAALMLKDDATLRTVEGTLRLMKSNLQTLQQKKDEDIERINKDVQLKVIGEIRSLNLVHVV
jgi:ERCC4-related helicase